MSHSSSVVSSEGVEDDVFEGIDVKDAMVEDAAAVDADLRALVDLMGNSEDFELRESGNYGKLAELFDTYEADFVRDEVLNVSGEDALQAYRTVEAKFERGSQYASDQTREVEADVAEAVSAYVRPKAGHRIKLPALVAKLKIYKEEWIQQKTADNRLLAGKKGRKGKRGKKIGGLYEAEIAENELMEQEMEAVAKHRATVAALGDDIATAYSAYRTQQHKVRDEVIPNVHKAYLDVQAGQLSPKEYDDELADADEEVWKLKGYAEGIAIVLRQKALLAARYGAQARRHGDGAAAAAARAAANAYHRYETQLEVDRLNDYTARKHERDVLRHADRAIGYLPAHWSTYIDDDGDLIYVNDKTGEETMDRPRLDTREHGHAGVRRAKRNVVQDLLAVRLVRKGKTLGDQVTRLERLIEESVDVALDLTYAWFNGNQTEAKFKKELVFIRNKLSTVKVHRNAAEKARLKKVAAVLFADSATSSSIPSWFGPQAMREARESLFSQIASEPAGGASHSVSSGAASAPAAMLHGAFKVDVPQPRPLAGGSLGGVLTRCGPPGTPYECTAAEEKAFLDRIRMPRATSAHQTRRRGTRHRR